MNSQLFDEMERRLITTLESCHVNTTQIMAMQNQMNVLQTNIQDIVDHMKLLTTHLTLTQNKKAPRSPGKKKQRQTHQDEHHNNTQFHATAQTDMMTLTLHANHDLDNDLERQANKQKNQYQHLPTPIRIESNTQTITLLIWLWRIDEDSAIPQNHIPSHSVSITNSSTATQTTPSRSLYQEPPYEQHHHHHQLR
jgi:hypothetical protein